MNSLLMDYGFNKMEYNVIEDHPDFFLVHSLVSDKIYRIEKEIVNGEIIYSLGNVLTV